jgi:uncharacterized membrane protein
VRALALAAVVALAVTAGAAPTDVGAASRHLINGMNVLEPISAVGTEPFWGITIDGRTVDWSDPEIENRTGWVNKPKLTRGKAVWKGRTDGVGAFTITITRGPCSDGMSDFTYPLTARVKTATYTFNGCASTVAAFERRDRENRDEGEIR